MKPLLTLLVVSLNCLCLLQTKPALSANNLLGFYTNFNDMQVIDQNNEPFEFDKLQSKIALFNFIYTQCSHVCHTQTQALSTVFHQLPASVREQIAFVSISLDPLKDGPQTLKKYAQNFNADVAGWDFLSLNFFDIKQLSNNLILFKPDYGKTLYDALDNTLSDNGSISYNLTAHSTHLWLIDTSGRVRQKYVGNPVDVARLTKELKSLHRIEFTQKN